MGLQMGSGRASLVYFDDIARVQRTFNPVFSRIVVSGSLTDRDAIF